MEDYVKERNRMVDEQIIARGIRDERVIEIMRIIPRHIFVEDVDLGVSYRDYPLPIGEKQTISQPYMVALMTECLELTDECKVLEIGTGSGYQTSILAKLSDMVYTVERLSGLMETAQKKLDMLDIHNVEYKVGDGTKGWFEYSPYDRIIVTAGAPQVPKTLLEQLNEGGIIVIPIGETITQMLTVFKKIKNKFTSKYVCDCRFVPLVGEFGWNS